MSETKNRSGCSSYSIHQYIRTRKSTREKKSTESVTKTSDIPVVIEKTVVEVPVEGQLQIQTAVLSTEKLDEWKKGDYFSFDTQTINSWSDVIDFLGISLDSMTEDAGEAVEKGVRDAGFYSFYDAFEIDSNQPWVRWEVVPVDEYSVVVVRATIG